MRFAQVMVGLLIFVVSTAYAQLSTFAIAIAGEEGKSVIARAGSEVDIAIKKSQEAGNGLISNLATHLSVLTEDANLVIGGNVSKAVRSLSPSEANLLGQIDHLTSELHDAQDRAYFMRDVTVVDFSNLEEAVPFFKVPYFVQTVSGVSQVIGDGEYKMQLVAYGIEVASDNKKSYVQFSVKDRATAPGGTGWRSIPARISVTRRGVADIFIQNSDLAPFFEPNKVAIVQAALKIVVTESRRFPLFKPKETTITAPLWLSLYPKKAGEITVVAAYPVYDWKFLERRYSPSEPVDKDQTKTYELRVAGGASADVPGSEKLTDPELHCDKSWSWPEYCGAGAWWGFAQQAAIFEDGKLASGAIRNTGERLWWSMRANVYRLTVSAQPATESKSYILEWGTPITIDLPPGWTDYHIKGTTITKRTIDLNQRTSMEHFLTFQNQPTEPPKPLRPTINYMVGEPQ